MSSVAVGVSREQAAGVKLYRFVKPVPSVLMANTVPLPPLPPPFAVPYRVLPDKINPAADWLRRCWLHGEGADGRENMQVRKARAIGVEGEHRASAKRAARAAVPYRVLPDKTNPASDCPVAVGIAEGTGIAP